MAFVESWVETDPDGSVITVSLLDDHVRQTKRSLRERMEGDAAVLGSGVYESGAFGTTAMVKKGVARAFTVTNADLTTTYLQDGRLAVNLDDNTLYHSRASGLTRMKVRSADIIAGTMPSGTTFPDITVTPGTSSLQAITGTTLTLTGAASSLSYNITTGNAYGIGGITRLAGSVASTNLYDQTGTLTITLATTAATFAGNINAVAGTFSSTLTLAALSSIVWTGEIALRSNGSGNLLITNSSGTTIDRVQLGGVTSSFPALARTGSTLLVVDATGASYVPVNAASFHAQTASSSFQSITATTGVFSGNVNAASYTINGIAISPGWYVAQNTKGLLVQNSGGSNKVAVTLDAANVWQFGDGLPAVFNAAVTTGALTATTAEIGGGTGEIAARFATDASGYLAFTGQGSIRSSGDGAFNLRTNAGGAGTGSLTMAALTATTGTFSSHVLGGANVQAGAGSVFYWFGRANLFSPADGIITLTNSGGQDAGFTLLQFGGTTGAFPALRRSGTALHVVTANESAYTGLVCGPLTVDNGGITVSAGASGFQGITATTGTFSGAVGVASLASSGAISGTTGAFSGSVTLTGAASDVIVARTAKLRLDGSGAGDDYISSPSDNTINVVCGGVTSCAFNNGGIFPVTGTTGSAANLHQTSSASQVLRSTSARRYKTDIRSLELQSAMDLIRRLQPVDFLSLSSADDPTRRFIGLVAEDVEKIDTRFVHYFQGRPDGVAYDRLTVPLLAATRNILDRLDSLEARLSA